ncbi:hypothetical protein ACVDG3_18430 [Meridianimarinicoccus sp. RP-17]|uniref:hypothetical protein n=1 Tax=Meridianimarinicoccus zhengii TaxID=2056810 RepID=UPI000DAC662A|nr:hypothetical protein [Phycocomes zhengii]
MSRHERTTLSGLECRADQSFPAADGARATGSGVGVAVIGLGCTVLLGVMASLAGFGLLLSFLIGWCGAIFGIVARVLYLGWKYERQERLAAAPSREEGTLVELSCCDTAKMPFEAGSVAKASAGPRGAAGGRPVVSRGANQPSLSFAREADAFGESGNWTHRAKP